MALFSIRMIEIGLISDSKPQQNYERLALLLALIVTLSLAIGSARAWGEDAYSMRTATPHASAQFPQSLVNALRPEGFRVYGKINGVETLICEIFWVRSVSGPDEARASTSVSYSDLKPGTLLGVIHFLIIERYVRDYRSQIFRPGYYTMRYSAMPEGENGSALDFALLSPVTADRNPDPVPALDEMVRRGRSSSRTKRPSMMSLAEIDNDQTFPSLFTDEEGTCTLQVKIRISPRKAGKGDPSRELPLALTVITAIPEDLGD
jgi:hypothetical protein